MVAIADGFGGRERVVEQIVATLHGRQVGETERDVLDENLQVVGALAIGESSVELAGLRVHEERLDLVAVPAEQGVRQEQSPQ